MAEPQSNANHESTTAENTKKKDGQTLATPTLFLRFVFRVFVFS